MDLDLSVNMNYRYFPLETQEDEFNIDLPPEGISGTLSSTMLITPFQRATISDTAFYRTQYVDTRGREDRTGGRKYQYFSNTLGLDIDWLLAKHMNFGVFGRRRDIIPTGDEFDDQERAEHDLGAVYEYNILQGVKVGARMVHRDIDYRDPDRTDASWQNVEAFADGNLSRLFRRTAVPDIPVTEATTLSVSLGTSAGFRARGSTRREERADLPARLTARADLRTRISRNLSHTLRYRRGVRGGFDSTFEEFESFGYNVDWARAGAGIGIYSRYSAAEPTSLRENDYSTWVSGVNLSYPLAEIITLRLSSSYAVRDNNEADIEDLDEESRADYETWTTRLATSFPLTKQVNVDTSIAHTERFSGSEDLVFDRQTFAVSFAYRHRF
jgi:hypothetical protein